MWIKAIHLKVGMFATDCAGLVSTITRVAKVNGHAVKVWYSNKENDDFAEVYPNWIEVFMDCERTNPKGE